MSKSSKKFLPSKQDNPSEWYTKVLELADLTDYGPSKGSVIIKPYGYAIWESIQGALDSLIKKRGIGNAYFPLLIPLELLEKEKNHVEGFAPELAVVTHAGNEELEQPLVIRPTSETIMYNSYAKWIQSWRDLPLEMNQWNNVVRWEKRTTPFLRTTEFLWQEGHTAHASHDEALEMQTWAMGAYRTIYREWLAIDGYVGLKSNQEKFSGADSTMTFESMMPSGKALQACTSHDLGQNFSKSFNILFQNKDGDMEPVWQTSWGLSTRSIGALILTHGDEDGLVLTPKIAPTQLVIVPVRADDTLVAYANKINDALTKSSIRSQVDSSDNERFGFKLNKWEIKGVPLLIQIGNTELEQSNVTVQARFNKERRVFDINEVKDLTSAWLDEIQLAMLQKSTKMQEENTRVAQTYDEFKALVKEHKGFIRVFWNDNSETEEYVKEHTKATSRCLFKQHDTVQGKDFVTGDDSSTEWLFAQSY